jgi:ribitol-5-phosphate 2-dehydrogenase
VFGKSFKIVESKRFDTYMEDIRCNDDEAIVKIERAAICKADLRYYLGQRDQKTLGLKYPMNLLHEAMGYIIKDSTKTYKIGDRVTLVPNLLISKQHDQSSCSICTDKDLGENYCSYAKFASSNYDGFSKEFVSYPVKNLVKLNPNHNKSVMAFSELVSVACCIYRRISLVGTETLGIWGDGVLGYILCNTLKMLHQNGKVIVIGKHEDKLKQFPADRYYLIGDDKIKSEKISVGYEVVGGNSSQNAINEMNEMILTGGKILLTGVAENPVTINTRKILEKGLSMYGVTRSSVKDFEQAVSLFQDDTFRNSMEKLILKETKIRNIVDFYKAFEEECNNKRLGKNIMVFDF